VRAYPPLLWLASDGARPTDAKKSRLSEEEIDRLVVEQAADADAWESAIHRIVEPIALEVPAELAARAAFLARLHRRASVEEWLTLVIRERVKLEEAAFVEARQELTARGSP
jgi:hypothetical protein